jgi:hypothetical protein
MNKDIGKKRDKSKIVVKTNITDENKKQILSRKLGEELISLMDFENQDLTMISKVL